jgi:hypothetical protein
LTTSVTRTSSTDPVRPVSHTGTSGRRVAVLGALVELAAERRMESSLGISRETLHQGRAGSRLDAAKILATAGALGAATVARRSRLPAAASSDIESDASRAGPP